MRVANLRLAWGDGYQGLAEAAPFDAIIVAAAAPRMPAALLEQLAPCGRLIAPVGTTAQQLQWMERTASGVIERALDLVHFVPLRSGKQ
jgi:protein-L-isoaspartate(D-aspartate) O-methyltransferase